MNIKNWFKSKKTLETELELLTAKYNLCLKGLRAIRAVAPNQEAPSMIAEEVLHQVNEPIHAK